MIRAIVQVAILAVSAVQLPFAADPRTSCEIARSSRDRTVAAFLDCATTSTRKYAKQPAAILDGYRRIGRDFPAMGERWIRPGLVFDGLIDPARPEVLTYVTVDGTPRLAGVAYALALLPGESAPDWPAQGAWHDHFRSIDDETTMPQHHAEAAASPARITMLHAWIGIENAQGIFAADNWAIPYVRLGVPPPADAPLNAGKALSLASGGADYFALCVEAVVPLTPIERQRMSAALDGGRRDVAVLVEAQRGRVFSPSNLQSLSDIWVRTWRAIEAGIQPSMRSHLQELWR